MISVAYIQMMAAYNRWQNVSVYAAADGLTEAARQLDRGAFFGSIHGTLNHLIWGDTIWLSRFAKTPPPRSPGIPGSVNERADWAEMLAERPQLDQRIIDWAAAIDPAELNGDLTWFSGAANRKITKPLWTLISHFHNHQTHHRGQVHALLTASGAKPGDTDLMLLPDE
ncbi:MAG: DinB family protein [Alphaproteobacteria bacterium]|nr:DinB family protein [Alphaproteobacteria bacterium]MBL6951602.1 DinB family protein [Alphaproteobacteria bacterium]